jgi:hypothetical protein
VNEGHTRESLEHLQVDGHIVEAHLTKRIEARQERRKVVPDLLVLVERSLVRPDQPNAPSCFTLFEHLERAFPSVPRLRHDNLLEDGLSDVAEVGGDDTEVTEDGLALDVVAAGSLVGKREANATLDELVGEGEEHADEEEREKRESEGGEEGRSKRRSLIRVLFCSSWCLLIH